MPNRHRDGNEVRSYTFSLRVNATERAMLKRLARKLERSRSDAVRMLVREALHGLNRAEEQGLVTSEPVSNARSEVEDGSDEVK